MTESRYAKYIRQYEQIQVPSHPHLSDAANPVIALHSSPDFGNKGFRLSWWGIDKPFVMESKTHSHDFDQYLMFVGGNLNNMNDLGGTVELSLGEEGAEIEKFVFTTATMVFIPKGLLHCPLDFKTINDPKYPILFHDFFFSPEYFRSAEVGDPSEESQFEAYKRGMHGLT